MNKTSNNSIPVEKIYAFIDPTAKGENKRYYRFFAVGKDNYGVFLHSGAKFFLDTITEKSNHISFCKPSIQTTFEGNKIVSKNWHNSFFSNKLTDLLATDIFAVKGIDVNALEAIRPLLREKHTTLAKCREYERLFVCAQEREQNKKFKQTSLLDFC